MSLTRDISGTLISPPKAKKPAGGKGARGKARRRPENTEAAPAGADDALSDAAVAAAVAAAPVAPEMLADTSYGALQEAVRGCQFEVRVAETTNFVGRPVPVEVYLMRDGELQHGDVPAVVWLEEEFRVPQVADPNSYIDVMPEGEPQPAQGGMVTIRNGVGKLRLVVWPDADVRGHTVRVRLSSPLDERMTGLSPKFTLYRHRLTFRVQPEEQFYKDEGGKSKCMEMQIVLENTAGVAPPQEDVPLTVQLLYENGDVPYQQDILTLNPDSDLTVSGTGAAARIRFRIEEVSKNHRGQKFRLKVAPDTKENPTLGNVASVTTEPILVLSKRKNVPLSRRQAGNGAAARGAAPAVRAAAPPPPLRQQQSLDSDHGSGGSTNGGNSAAAAALALPTPPPALPGKRLATAAAAAEAVAALDALNIPTGGAPGTPQASLTWLLGWAQEAASLMRLQLEWEPVGFEASRDGTPDTSRPIYRCPSCRQYRDASAPQAAHLPQCQLAGVLGSFYQQAPVAMELLTGVASEPSAAGRGRETPSADAGAGSAEAAAAAGSPAPLWPEGRGAKREQLSLSLPPPSPRLMKRTRFGGNGSTEGGSFDGTGLSNGNGASGRGGERLNGGPGSAAAAAAAAAAVAADAKSNGPSGLQPLSLPGGLSFGDRGVSQQMWTQNLEQMADGEENVQYILAEEVFPHAIGGSDGGSSSGGTDNGQQSGALSSPHYPAFDASQGFIGYYEEQFRNGLEICFRPTERLPPATRAEAEAHAHGMSQRLQQALAAGSGAVLSVEVLGSLAEAKRLAILATRVPLDTLSRGASGDFDQIGGLMRFTTSDMMQQFFQNGT